MAAICRSGILFQATGALIATSAVLTIACGGARNPVAPRANSAGAPAFMSPPAAVAGAQANIAICHRTRGSNAFVPITIASSALDAHLGHGDALVGDPVPGQPGMKFGADCTPESQETVTITFSGLPGDSGPFCDSPACIFSSYTESAFEVVATQGNWAVRGDYGNPQPFIYFRAPGGETVTGQIRLTAGGSPFRFGSIDLYSSLTTIPYVITGLRNSAVIFTVNGTVPNTFGQFATVMNPQSTDVIDTLFVTLTNTAPLCCDNPMGLDNIVVVH